MRSYYASPEFFCINYQCYKLLGILPKTDAVSVPQSFRGMCNPMASSQEPSDPVGTSCWLSQLSQCQGH